MTQVRLGRMQLRIMKVLWEKGSANAREITDALCRDEAVAHSTVQTLLRKLENKGAVRHETSDRTFVFHPMIDNRSVTRGATRDLIERVFGGSAAGLVAHLLKEERIGRKEMDQIRKLIEEHESRNKGKA
jgi:BlaI family penicillinase repressor